MRLGPDTGRPPRYLRGADAWLGDVRSGSDGTRPGRQIRCEHSSKRIAVLNAGQANGQAGQGAAAPAAPALNEDLASVLSPSQCNKWCDCPAAWYFHYFRGLPDSTDGKRALGQAVHAALAANFRQKIETRKDLTREALFETYSEAWNEAAAKATFAADDDVAELERTGLILAQKYLLEAAPEIQPAAVELAVAGEIGSVAVRGYVDLLDVNGCIIDLKTASKKPSALRAPRSSN
jgi:hypothetical protein